MFYSLILPTKRMNPRAAKCNGIKKAGKKFVKTYIRSNKDPRTASSAHRGTGFGARILASKLLEIFYSFVFRNLLVRGVKHFNVKEPKAVFKEFIVWLKKFENPVLIGHNGFRFDAPVTIRSMIRFGLFSEFKDACKLFGDTLVPMKAYFGSESQGSPNRLVHGPYCWYPIDPHPTRINFGR